MKTPGFKPFLATQFLGAFIDNVFKMIVTFYVIRTVDKDTGTSIAAAVFILPFLLFSGYAGRIADGFSKRSVLIWTTSMGIPVTLLAIPALLANRGDLLLIGLFFMAAQAAFFSPAKYGIVPEMMPDTELSRANGLLEMSSFLAIVAGTLAGRRDVRPLARRAVVARGGPRHARGPGDDRQLRHRAVSSRAGEGHVLLNPFTEIGRGIARVYPDRTLRMTMLGIGFVWFLGAFMQMVLVPFGLHDRSA